MKSIPNVLFIMAYCHFCNSHTRMSRVIRLSFVYVLILIWAFLPSFASVPDSHHKSLGTVKELMNRAASYDINHHPDSALIYYDMIANHPYEQSLTPEHRKLIVKALNRSAAIYGGMSDYRTAFRLLVQALTICDEYNLDSEKSDIYNNIGNIYYTFKKYPLANTYYRKALELNRSNSSTFMILNNLVNTGIRSGKTDSVRYWLRRCEKVDVASGGKYKYLILNSKAFMHSRACEYDSALKYYRLSLDESRKINSCVTEASILSALGELSFNKGDFSSALKYVAKSDSIAVRDNFKAIVADNRILLAQIREREGNLPAALKLYKEYYLLNDSILNISHLGEISDMQRVYEAAKTNRHIEQLGIEQEIREKTIGYQRALMWIGGTLLLLSIGFIIYILKQKRNLSTAYEVLMKKNLEIVALQDQDAGTPAVVDEPKNQDAMWPADLPEKIRSVMDDEAMICDPKFTINRLSELVGTNRTYVSSYINSAEGKNFRTFLNEYRIQVAQRIFARPESAKYTVETVAAMVGFKSSSSFRDAFKEITGVTPGFYMKSIKAQRGE